MNISKNIFSTDFCHALSVTHGMFSLLVNTSLSTIFEEREKYDLIIACFCHDMDHRGLNNGFQKQVGTSALL